MAKKTKTLNMSSGSLTGTNVTIGTSNVNTTGNWANSTITLGNNVNAIYGNGHGSWGSATIQQPKITYVILGEEYETDGYSDPNIAIAIATLNILGKPYWLELKKQSFSFGYNIDAFIEERITILDRDKKIDDLLK
jgi:hypothetical protein